MWRYMHQWDEMFNLPFDSAPVLLRMMGAFFSLLLYVLNTNTTFNLTIRDIEVIEHALRAKAGRRGLAIAQGETSPGSDQSLFFESIHLNDSDKIPKTRTQKCSYYRTIPA